MVKSDIAWVPLVAKPLTLKGYVIILNLTELLEVTDMPVPAAEVEEVKYAMGQSNSLHDLMVAQQKANVSLQYTVAVKNTAVEAYRSIMNMQI